MPDREFETSPVQMVACRSEVSINAPVELVFAVLTRTPMVWWQLPFLNTDSNHIALETKVGGHLIERFDGDTDGGVILGTITALRSPVLLALEGSFGTPVKSNLTIGLTPSNQDNRDDTNVVLVFVVVIPTGDESGAEQSLALMWKGFLRRLKAIAEASAKPALEYLSKSEIELPQERVSDETTDETSNAEMQLDQVYQQLQNQLISLRQSVAQAIASEKRLEQSIYKNKEQVSTWQNRAQMALEQNNDDLALQAEERADQYRKAADELEEQHTQQRKDTALLREKLTELEGQVQRIYTRKQVLVARMKAADATSKAIELLHKTTDMSAVAVLEEMERRVAEREAQTLALKERTNPPT